MVPEKTTISTAFHFQSQAPGEYPPLICRTGPNVKSDKIKSDLFVVKKESKYFGVGDEIPESGLYHVFHAEHRTSHKAVLLKGQPFPRCGTCKDDVHFQLIRGVPELDSDPNFKSFRLYEIPHKKKDEKKKESA